MNSGDPGKPENQEERAGGSVLSRVANGWSALRIFPLFQQRPKGMRERILLSIIIIGILFSGLAAVPAVLLALRERLWVPLSMDVVVLACGLGLLIGKGLRYEVKAWSACALIYIVGVYVVFFFGFLSGGPIWLFSFAVVCGLLLGVKPAIIAICVNVATLGILGWLHAATPLGDNVPFFFSPLNALAAGGNFIFLNTLAAISCALLIQDEKEASISLTREKSQILEAKRELEEEVISRKEAEKKQREFARELEFLHTTAMEFVNVRDEEALYHIIGMRIKAILGGVVVVVNSFDPETRHFRTMSVEGLGPVAERFLNILGRNPVGMVTTLSDEFAEQTLKTGKLAEGPKGIHDLSFGAIPTAIAHSLDKLVGIRRIYVIGFVRDGQLFGSAVIVDRNRPADDDLQRNHDLVEAYVNQASLALLRNRFEIDLKESEERYRQLFNNVPAGICEIDFKNFGITNVNDIMCEYTGYSKEELLLLDPLRLLAEESLEHFADRGRRIMAGELIPESTEYEIRRKDGSAFWARCHSKAIREQGLPVKTTMVFHDITELRTLEEEKKQLQDSLLEARKMEAIATLAGGIAHQFNNALSVVSVSMDMLELCKEETGGDLKYTDMIRESIQKMTKLTSQLLAYARGGKYYARTLILSRFVAETLPTLLPEMPISVKVETDLSQDVLPVQADPKQMRSVLSAILTNAAEAMEGGGTIHITCANQKVRKGDVKKFPDVDPGDYVALVFEDTGKGMDEKTLRKIFEPFFTTKFQGRGLAMPAVLGIVKNHGGWIDVESEVGEGTIVRILLPVFEEKAEE